MLTFNQLPATAETTEVDAEMIRYFAYDISELRRMGSVAEVCASVVFDNSDTYEDIMAIGLKIADTLEAGEAKVSERYIHERDSNAFMLRYGRVVSYLGKKSVYKLASS